MTPALAAKLGNRRVVASVSGGKDSAALSLWLKEQDIEHQRIYLDTGWEHPSVYEYIRGELARVIGPINELRGKLPMVELIRKKMMFPSRGIRFCTEELKTFPVRDHLNDLVEAGDDVVNAIGIRRAESLARSTMPEWEWMKDFDAEVWRPLILWTLDDVIAIHKRHGLAPNPLYLKGMDRVGCWPCINSNKAEVRKIAEIDPSRIDTIRALEEEVGLGAKMRYDKRMAKFNAGGAEALTKMERNALLDEAGNPKPFNRPSFFQSPLKEEGGRCWPIDRVVEWSRTKFGGREKEEQMDLLSFGGINDGCMRWGACETSPDKPGTK